MRNNNLQLAVTLLAGGLVWSATSPASAQRGFRGGRFDPQEIYARMDKNQNGLIEPDEISDRARPFVEQAARQAGLDPAQPLPISKLVPAPSDGAPATPATPATPTTPATPSANATSGADADRRDRGRDDSSGSSSGGSSSGGTAPSGSSSGGGASAAPAVAGFGMEDKTPKPPGFDAPPPAAVAAQAALAQKYDRRVVEMLDGMFREYDKNRDDLLDESEIARMTWRSDPKESDTNKDGKLSRAEMAERLAKRFQSDRGSSGGSSGSSSGSSSSGGSSEDNSRVKRYAEGLLKQNDANSNGLLERNEWSEVKSISKDTDANNDGIVTLDELVAKLSNYGKSSGSTASSGSTPSSSGSGSSSTASASSGGSSSSGSRGGWGSGRYGSSSSSTSAKSGERKTYRALTPLERLPKGLPDWFARNDADADGQVAMAEFSSTWSDSKAEEFAKYDLNGDGFITSAECLKVDTKK